MEQVIFGGAGYGAPAPQTDTRYNYLQGGYTWAAAEYQRLQLISTDGVIKKLRFRLSAAPGAGKKRPIYVGSRNIMRYCNGIICLDARQGRSCCF